MTQQSLEKRFNSLMRRGTAAVEAFCKTGSYDDSKRFRKAQQQARTMHREMDRLLKRRISVDTRVRLLLKMTKLRLTFSIGG